MKPINLRILSYRELIVEEIRATAFIKAKSLERRLKTSLDLIIQVNCAVVGQQTFKTLLNILNSGIQLM